MPAADDQPRDGIRLSGVRPRHHVDRSVHCGQREASRNATAPRPRWARRSFGSATGSNSRVGRIASTVYPAEIGSVALQEHIDDEPAFMESQIIKACTDEAAHD